MAPPARSGDDHFGSLALLFMAVVVATAVHGGCAATPPPGNPLPPSGERAALAEHFSAIAAGHEPTRVAVPAGDRGRWEDVDLALYWAAAEAGIEMAVTERVEYSWGWLYRLKTIEGWPVSLRIERVEGDRVYERHAEVGRFPDREVRRVRARRLEEAFDRFMKELGRKRTLPAE